jgi:hypothetical protein
MELELNSFFIKKNTLENEHKVFFTKLKNVLKLFGKEKEKRIMFWGRCAK